MHNSLSLHARAHADYSCGCMDYGFRRAREPWEASDGAARALVELAGGAAPAAVPDFLPALAEVARLDHFRRCRQLQETVWCGLPRIAAGLGKRVRRRWLPVSRGQPWALLHYSVALWRFQSSFLPASAAPWKALLPPALLGSAS